MGKPGRPPKLKGPSRLVAYRLPATLLARIDQYVAIRLRRENPTASQADAVRDLLERGLAQAEREDRDLRDALAEIVGSLARRRGHRSG